MNQIIPSSCGALLPLPQLPINVRPATAADLPFMDALQKLHTKSVGWMPTATLEGKIKAGHVLVAEERHEGTEARRHEGEENSERAPLLPAAYCPPPACQLGYVIATDQYFKHDDVGIIYQLNVLPGKQRGLIGASLLKAQFERSAYGCKLYCCWCAQDIAANYFWEAMGFVPLAFRAGSEKRSRVHIFWQKRIRQGDTTTPFWFPAQTSSGAIREDRIVLPIPPEMRWSDEMPRILPREQAPKLEHRNPKPIPPATTSVLKQIGPGGMCSAVAAGALRLLPPAKPSKQDARVESDLKRDETHQSAKTDAPSPKPPRVKAKNDPMMIAAARELRDRWLEEVNAGRYLPESAGKYEVSRTISSVRAELPAATVTAKLIAA